MPCIERPPRLRTKRHTAVEHRFYDKPLLSSFSGNFDVSFKRTATTVTTDTVRTISPHHWNGGRVSVRRGGGGIPGLFSDGGAEDVPSGRGGYRGRGEEDGGSK